MSPCESCHAGCCRSFAVPISGADIIRIERKHDTSFWKFACRWADPQGTISKNVAPQFYFSDDANIPYVICLAHDESLLFPGTTKCQFLVEGTANSTQPFAQAHCGVYENRPLACRNFPMRLNETSDLAILYELPASGREGGNDAYRLCPEPLQPTDFDPIQSVQELVVSKYEMQYFHQVAELWNRKPRDWKHFPEFLRLIYTQRIAGNEVNGAALRQTAEPDPGDASSSSKSIPPRSNSAKSHAA